MPSFQNIYGQVSSWTSLSLTHVRPTTWHWSEEKRYKNKKEISTKEINTPNIVLAFKCTDRYRRHRSLLALDVQAFSINAIHNSVSRNEMQIMRMNGLRVCFRIIYRSTLRFLWNRIWIYRKYLCVCREVFFINPIENPQMTKRKQISTKQNCF